MTICQGSGEEGRVKGFISRVVSQSAAAGHLWLSEGKGNHRGHVAGGPPNLNQVTHPLYFARQVWISSKVHQCRNQQLQYMLLPLRLPNDGHSGVVEETAV